MTSRCYLHTCTTTVESRLLITVAYLLVTCLILKVCFTLHPLKRSKLGPQIDFPSEEGSTIGFNRCHVWVFNLHALQRNQYLVLLQKDSTQYVGVFCSEGDRLRIKRFWSLGSDSLSDCFVIFSISQCVTIVMISDYFCSCSWSTQASCLTRASLTSSILIPLALSAAVLSNLMNRHPAISAWSVWTLQKAPICTHYYVLGVM